MPRQIPDIPTKWQPPQPSSDRSYDIELITPMVGGGARAGVVDLDFPVRPTAIRGHLRHWWRLIRGHSLGRDMWQREEEIFGSTEFPSPVTVSVSKGSITATLFPISRIKPTSIHGYVLFPVIDKHEKNPHENYGLLQEGYQFQVRLSNRSPDQLKKCRQAQNRNRKPTVQLPDEIAPIDDDVLLSMNAWLLFGGLGARTRRGCGSIRLTNRAMPNLIQVLQQFPHEYRVYQSNRRQKHLDAWEKCIDMLKKFRQQMPTQRGGPRLKFPEAETLRRITGVRGRRNRPIPETEMPSGFPRAELGLPIVFQFKDGSGPDGMTALPHGLDSEKKQLQRMASPVILKPVPVSETESLATLIILRKPTGLTVDVAGAPNQPVTGAQFENYPNSPLAGTSGSAIEAFLKFAHAEGFQEVPRS